MKMTNNPKVVIIILNWDGFKDTLECLKSVREASYKNFEVIVVDNGSTDGSPPEIKALFPKVTVLENGKNLGFTEGNNMGMRWAIAHGASYVWLLNNDTVVNPDSLGHLVKAMENNLKQGLATPVIYFYGTSDKIQNCGSFLSRQDYGVCDVANIDDILKFNQDDIYLWGTALLIRKDVIEKIGYLDNRFFAYFEDADYSERARNAGYELQVIPEARVYHKARGTEEQRVKSVLPHYFFYMTRNQFFFWKKHLKGIKRFAFPLFYLAKTLRRLAYLKAHSGQENIDACLQGLICAFRGVDGAWKKDVKVPHLMKRFLLAHPFFLADLLEGNFGKLGLTVLKRMRSL